MSVCYVVLQTNYSYDDRETSVVAVFLNRQDAEKRVADYNKQTVESYIDDLVEKFQLNIDTSHIKCPQFDRIKPVFDLEQKHNEVYRQLFMLLTRKYHKVKQDYERNAIKNWQKDIEHYRREKTNVYRNSIDHEELLACYPLKSADIEYSMQTSVLQ